MVNYLTNKLISLSWLRLIRWNNLLIIFLTQIVAWWCVIRPEYKQESRIITFGLFMLISISTMLIAAAGYIINDYFDIRIDAINKPNQMVLDKTIPRRMAIIVHSIMNALALLMAGSVALYFGHLEWLWVQVLCTILLWRYSSTWKRQFMIGNVVVALMTGLSIVVLMVYDPASHYYLGRSAFFHEHVRFGNTDPNPVFVLSVFAFFAFLLTWMREVVKDMEDFKGDEAEGCVTMPIQWGLLKSSRFVQVLSFVCIVLLSITAIQLWWNASVPLSLSGIWIVLFLILPLLVWTINLPRKATSQHYHKASRWLKIIMVSGVISLLLLSSIEYA